MKILVAGGAGLVGSHPVDALVEKHEIVIYDNLEPQVHKGILEYLNNVAEFIKEDIHNKAKLKEALSDSEIVFHQAAMAGIGQSIYQVEKIKDFLSVMLTRRVTGVLVSGRNEFEPTLVGEFRRSRNTRKDILSYASKNTWMLIPWGLL